MPKYHFILPFLLAFAFSTNAQIIIPWSNSLNITFGDGIKNPGPALSTGYTDYKFTNDSCPPPGQYTILNKTYSTCNSNTWIAKSSDHTPFSNHGYMMVINDTSTRYTKTVFRDTIKQVLCHDVNYMFSAWVLNLETTTFCSSFNVRFPHLTFNVETVDGVILQSGHTGAIDYAGSGPPKYPFVQYGVNFMLPAGVNNFVVKILDDSSGYTPCGYAFAIDDIQVLPVGPDLTASLVGLPGSIQTSVCFQDKSNVQMTGTIDPGFTTPAVQWQQSNDQGFTWTDVPGQNSLNFSEVFSSPDSFLVRMRASETSNIGNQNCSVISNVIGVLVDGLPRDFSFTSNAPVCTGTDLIFTLSGGASYFTTGPNGFSDNSPFPHVFNPTLSDSGWYYTQVVSQGGCKSTDSIFAKVIGPDVHAYGDTAICYGSTVQLRATGGDLFRWSPPAGISDTTVANPLASPIVTTTYKVKVTDTSGCIGSASVVVRLLDSALKALFLGPDVVCPRDVAVFKDTSVGSIVTWRWDLGNGQVSDGQNPSPQRYTTANGITDYIVKLAVTDTAGCVDTVSHALQSVNNCFIAVPSAFTPNGDGHNDYLYPLNAYKATNLEFRVFNREGQLVFETRDWTRKWDGNINGSPQPPGVFVWTLNYTDADGIRVSLKGTSVLVR